MKRFLSIIVCSVLALVLCLTIVGCQNPDAYERTSSEGITYAYIPESQSYSVRRYTGSSTEVVISDEYDDGTNGTHSVTTIGDYAINSERDLRKTQQKTPNNIENSLQMIA